MKLGILALLSLTTIFAADEIQNGQQPKGQALKLIFTEELRITADDNPDYFMWSGDKTAVQIDDRGHMFVVDAMENRIIEINPAGTFVQVLGGKGSGPGEYQMLQSFQLLAEGAVAFDNDQNRIAFTFFNKDLSFKNRDLLQIQGRFIQAANFAPDGRTYAGAFMDFQSERGIMLAQMGILRTKDREALLTLTQKEQIMFNPQRANEQSWWIEFMSSWFRIAGQDQGIIAFAGNGDAYTALSDTYQITVYDKALNKKRVISRQYKPKPWAEGELLAFIEPIRDELMGAVPNSQEIFTESMVKRTLEAAEFKPRKPAVMGLIPMPQGHLLVIHDYRPATGEVIGDLFDADGAYRGASNLPPIRVNLFGGFFGSPQKIQFKGEHAYTIEFNDQEEPELVRYRVAIKTAM